MWKIKKNIENKSWETALCIYNIIGPHCTKAVFAYIWLMFILWSYLGQIQQIVLIISVNLFLPVSEDWWYILSVEHLCSKNIFKDLSEVCDVSKINMLQKLRENLGWQHS